MTKRDSESQSPVAEIAKHGDPIGRQLLLSRLTPGTIFAGVEGAALGAVVSPEVLRYPIDSMLGAPIYGLAGVALSSIAYGGLRKIDQVKSQKAELVQSELRTLLNEPIDLITSGKGKKQELTLRWYGADHKTSADTLETAARYRAIVNFAAANGIHEVVVDAEWAKMTLNGPAEQTIAPEEFGTEYAGETFVTDRKKSKIDVHDMESAETVLVSTVQQAEALISHIEENGEDLLISELVKRSNDPELLKAYRLNVKTEGKSHARFTQQVQARLEQILNQESTGVARGRTASGAPIRERTHLHRRIQGEYVHTVARATGPESSGGSTHEMTSLLDAYDARSLRELTAGIIRSKAGQTSPDQTLAAIYLLAVRRDKEVYDGTTRIAKALQRPKQHAETLFTRVQLEPRPFSPALRKLLAKNNQSSSVEYESPKTLRKGGYLVGAYVLAAGLMAGASFMFDVTAGDIAVDRFNWCDKEGIFDIDFDRPDDEDFDVYWDRQHGICKADYAVDHQLEAPLADVYVLKSDTQWNASDVTRGALGDLLTPDMISAMAPLVSLTDVTGWRAGNLKDIPPGLYTGASDQSFIGDAGVETNKAIYTIDAPNGDSTEGYWYTNTFPFMTERNGKLAFSGNTQYDGYSQDENFNPYTEYSNKALNDEADYIVSTPYFNEADFGLPETDTKLPTLAGTEIMDVRIVDGADPNKFETINSRATREDAGSYTAGIDGTDITNMANANFENPTMTYWLKKKPVGKAEHRYVGPMYYPAYEYLPAPDNTAEEAEKNEEKAYNHTLSLISNRAKAALGISESATPEQVLDAIKSKKYSYTPVADAGLRELATSGSNSYETFANTGEAISRLDAVNCNLASAAFILATMEDTNEVNQATGFHDDGDGVLTQREAHAWIIDKDSKIIDPTPSGFTEQSTAPDKEESDEKPEDPIQPIQVGGIALAAAGAFALWRNRRRIAKTVDALNVKLAVSNKTAPKAMEIIEHALYGPKDQPTDWTKRTTNLSQPTVNRLHNNTFGRPVQKSVLKTALSNPTITAREKRSVKQLNRAAAASERIIKNQS